MSLLPPPTPLISGASVAQLLEIDRRTGNKLARAGLFGRTYASDRGGLLVQSSEVERFQRRQPVAAQHPAAFVVRLDAATPEENPERAQRAFRGWHAELVEHPDALAAWDRWWPVHNPDRVRDSTVLAVIGPVIVEARHVLDLTYEFGRWRLITTDLDASARKAFFSTDNGSEIGRLVSLAPGATTAYLESTS
jgi:hypothetical protein